MQNVALTEKKSWQGDPAKMSLTEIVFVSRNIIRVDQGPDWIN